MIGHHFSDRVIDRVLIEKPFAHKLHGFVLHVKSGNVWWKSNWIVMKSNFHFFALFSLQSATLSLSRSLGLSLVAFNKLTEREETNYDTLAHISHISATSHLLAAVSVIYKLILLSANNIQPCMFWLIYMFEKCTTLHSSRLCFLCCLCVVTVTVFISSIPLQWSELVSIFT